VTETSERDITPCFDRDPVRPEALDVSLHQGRRSRQHERQDADPGRQVDDRLGLPAQQAPAEPLLVAVGREVAEIGQVGWLAVNDGVEVGPGPGNRVVVDGEVGVPFGRQPLEEASRGRQERARRAVVADPDDAQVRHRIRGDVAQAPAGSRDDHVPAGEVRSRLGQPDLLRDGEAAPDLDGPADADRDVAGGALGGVDRRDALAALADGREDLVELREGFLDRHVCLLQGGWAGGCPDGRGQPQPAAVPPARAAARASASPEAR
jgi:hypothetical protein